MVVHVKRNVQFHAKKPGYILGDYYVDYNKSRTVCINSSNHKLIHCNPLDILHCLRASLNPSQRLRSDCCWAHWIKLLISQAQAPAIHQYEESLGFSTQRPCAHLEAPEAAGHTAAAAGKQAAAAAGTARAGCVRRRLPCRP